MPDQFCRVTLEKAFKGGGYRMRVGTEDAIRNPLWDPSAQNGEPQWIPGKPIYYPSDGTYLIAGDPERDSVVVPIAVAKTEFGDWEAPEREKPRGIRGHTKSREHERLAQRWNMYIRPPSNGSLNPDMTPLGLNEYPQVAIRMLDARGSPVRDDNGEVIIRPFKFFGFEDERFPERPSANGATPTKEVDDLKTLVLQQQAQINQLVAAGGKRGDKVS